MRRRLRFEFKYWKGRPTWDTGVTPPEVMDFLASHPPGRAVDLGCGTGTNAVTLARQGWEVTGVDFSWRAIHSARRKARAAGVTIRFLRQSVTDLAILADPFDWALDVGCFHSLEPEDRSPYAREVSRLVRPAGTYLLYAFLDPEGGWPAEAEVRRQFDPAFRLGDLQHGDFDGRPSAWFTWIRNR